MKFNAAMDVDTPVLEGYLNVPNQSGFSINRISKKKTCHRYCLLYKSSRHGIERLEICESKDDKNRKIITLENCVKITQEPPPVNSIQIVKKTGTLTLTALTEEDVKEWINALQTVAFRDKATTHATQAAIEEDNDLYCSSYGDGLFIVKLISTETSMRCNIEPKTYMLHLSATELQLKSHEDLNFIIAKWPYRFIRKYGYRDGKFTFEAGRKCFTGEGVFTLDHVNPQEVFRCMSAKMKSMKKLISGDSIDCGENQLCAVASMEAGSRSPLPPSPSKQHASDFEINSVASLRGLLSSSDSLNNFSINSNSTTSNNNSVASLAGKQVPNKPPRKLPTPLEKLNISAVTVGVKCTATPPPTSLELKANSQLNCDQFKNFQNYEPVAITSCMDPNKNIISSSVLLKPAVSPETNIKRLNIPPSLPLRNDSNKNNAVTSTATTPTMLAAGAERDYESIESITDAWKTLGLNDVKHNERVAASISNEDDILEFVRQQRVKCPTANAVMETPVLTGKTKIIDIDIGEGGCSHTSQLADASYDRLDFLTPNNKASSGYKTIVTVSSPRLRYSPPPSNDYELIASPDIQPYRKADDSHLGYGILRKASTFEQQLATTSTTTTTTTTTTGNSTPTRAAIKNSENLLEYRNYNGLKYTVVSKPKTV